MKSLSRVRLLATPRTAAYQAPPSMGFSRQEYWSGVPLPSPPLPHAAAAAKSLQSCPILCDPRDGRLPGSPVPGILQARVLEWGAIAFSGPFPIADTKIHGRSSALHRISWYSRPSVSAMWHLYIQRADCNLNLNSHMGLRVTMKDSTVFSPKD